MPAGIKQREHVQLKTVKDSVKRSKLNYELQCAFKDFATATGKQCILAAQKETRNHNSWHKPFTAAHQRSCCQDYFSRSQINNKTYSKAAQHCQIYVIIAKWPILKIPVAVVMLNAHSPVHLQGVTVTVPQATNTMIIDTIVISITFDPFIKTDLYFYLMSPWAKSKWPVSLLWHVNFPHCYKLHISC